MNSFPIELKIDIRKIFKEVKEKLQEAIKRSDDEIFMDNLTRQIIEHHVERLI